MGRNLLSDSWSVGAFARAKRAAIAGAVARRKPRDVKVRERAERVRMRRRREVGVCLWEDTGSKGTQRGRNPI